MELEKQVCSLELAKKLKELRVEQDSLFYWYKFKDCEHRDFYAGYHEDVFIKEINFGNIIKYSAFTVAELGEMLPKGTKTWKHLCDEKCDPRYRGEDIGYHVQLPDISYAVLGNTEADARAKMLIYLLENDLIKAKDLG